MNIKRVDLIARFLEYSKKLKNDVIDELIDFAVTNNNAEASALLIEYKRK